MAKYPRSVDVEKHKEMFDRVLKRVNAGTANRKELIQRIQSQVIRDKLVPPKLMTFDSTAGALHIVYPGAEGKTAEAATIHRHALSQLAQKVSVPLSFAQNLRTSGQLEDDWKPVLLAHILNEHYKNIDFPERSGKQPAFLHRLVGTELRGFLSRRFNRHIASGPLLGAFVESCEEMGAVVFDATSSDVRFSVKYYLPYVFEPIPGEMICVGAEWSNSDFGAGRHTISLTVWRPNSDSFTVLDQALSRVHIGSVIDDADIDLDEATQTKEAETQASAVRHVVSTQLDPESINRLLDAVRQAAADEIPWAKLRGQLAKYMSKKEVDTIESLLTEGIIDLPPTRQEAGGILATRWWASSALGWLAKKQEDPERRASLEAAAGDFLPM